MIALFVLCIITSCDIPATAETQPITGITPSNTIINTAPIPHPVTTPTTKQIHPTATSEETQPKTIPTQSATNIPQFEDEIPPFIPVIGGSDKIAFIDRKEIWIANLDGKALTQLTDDGENKSSLHWSPDGGRLFFISGQCIKFIEFDTSQEKEIACFEPNQELITFQISPDGTHAAISLDHDLYVVPFEPNKLSQVTTGADLAGLGTCSSLSPYKHRQSLVRVKRAY